MAIGQDILSKVRSYAPIAPFILLWRERALIRRLVVRDILARYKGSIFGSAWLVVQPLLMLGVYTFVFSVVFKAKWGESTDQPGVFALYLFAGLLIFNLFSEPVGRAPSLILENVSYVKKVVFPLEVLSWVAVLGALFSGVVNLLLILLASIPVFGGVSLLSWMLILPVSSTLLFALGCVWIFSALGVYLRDIKPIVGMVLTVLMFLSPIFYPVSAVPERFHFFLSLNPLSIPLEFAREVLFQGSSNHLIPSLVHLLVSLGIAWLGLIFFRKTKKGFPDVI